MSDQTPHDQLTRIQELAATRHDDERIYDHMREQSNTFVSILCFLIGYGAITDEALEAAIANVREGDEQVAAKRAVQS